MELADSLGHYLGGLQGDDREQYQINLLHTCARFIENGEFNKAGVALKDIGYVSSPDGDKMQRLATYFQMALSNRLMQQIRPFPGVFSCLTYPWSTSEREYARNLSFHFIPFFKFAYLITNQAILDAMEREPEFHIIDLNPSNNAAQWKYLLRTLKQQRQGNPLPRVKITVIHENKDILQRLGSELIQEAEQLNTVVHFHGIVSQLKNVCFENLSSMTPGEPLAISCALILHSLLALVDNQTNNNNHDDDSYKMREFLHQLWKLHPRLMVITEQESDNNGPSLSDRLHKALNFYAAKFECLEANAPKDREIERITVERMILGEEIKSIIACDGVGRKERHGKFLKTWSPLLQLAAFKGVPINYERMLEVTRSFMQQCGNGYKLLDDDQCLFTCWKDLPLYSISAWSYEGWRFTSQST